MVWDPASDAWLSGFADGEATFTLGLRRQRCGDVYEVIGVQPWFAVSLRADDVAVLEALSGAFGGTVRYESQRGAARHPRYTWAVAAKGDLRRLLGYFDRFPLRAKKARDYAIWRRAVTIYLAEGARAPELPALRTALMGGRAYAPASRPGPRAEVTRADVAQAAGVSRTTITRVLRGDPDELVLPTTRARVERVIAEMGYTRGAKTGRARPTLRRVV